MGYLMNENQRELISMVDDFLTKKLDPIVMEYDERGELPMDVVNQGMEMGLNMLDVPEQYGGTALDPMTMQMMIQTMCSHDVGFTAVFSITSMVMNSIIAMGTKNQAEKYAKKLQNGGIMGFCLTEPTGSSDATNMHTSAVKQGNSYILNGTKCFITNGDVADAFIVFAVTDKAKGAHGISCFMIDREAPGLSVSKHENKLGMRLSPTNEVVFQDCAIPVESLLGPEGEGYITAMKTLGGGRISVGSMGIGVAERAIKEAVKYSSERILFGRPELDNQGVSFELAKLDARLEACKALVEHTIRLRESGNPAEKQCSMSKLLGTNVAVEAATAAVQFFGGYGVCKDYPVEKLYRDAKVLQLVEGANEVQALLISRRLKKDYL